MAGSLGQKNRHILAPLLWLCSGAWLSAQTDFLWLEDGAGSAGGNDYAVDLSLVNANELGGFQFVLTYDTAALSIDTVIALERVSDVDLFYDQTFPGEVAVLVAGLSGGVVEPGVGGVVRFELSVKAGAVQGASPLTVREIDFSDPVGNTRPSAAVDGTFIVQGAHV
ncbi:MAG: hypothetical protein IH971_10650, partial [Candidatus Marinimicrobia bacterium]|nr:hypothetical protein [Candidatus Neomarinimicrobiota bacterium]